MVDWFAELDVAARMEEPDTPGFAPDKHQPSEIETLGSKIAPGIMKIILAGFKRKVHVLEETQSMNKFPMLTGKDIMFQTFSFFNTNKTQGHTMNLSDFAYRRAEQRQHQHVESRSGKKHY